MTSFSHRALQTGIEGISGEQSEQLRLTDVFRIRSVMVHEGLETWDTANRFRRPWSGRANQQLCLSRPGMIDSA